jgi:hypothetical protein
MEYKLPSTQEDPPLGDNGVKNNNIDEAHCEMRYRWSVHRFRGRKIGWNRRKTR